MSRRAFIGSVLKEADGLHIREPLRGSHEVETHMTLLEPDGLVFCVRYRETHVDFGSRMKDTLVYPGNLVQLHGRVCEANGFL